MVKIKLTFDHEDPYKFWESRTARKVNEAIHDKHCMEWCLESGEKMDEPTNKDLIRMHLEEFVRNYPDQTWGSLLAYCIGYYGKIDMDILWTVWGMQQEGLIK